MKKSLLFGVICILNAIVEMECIRGGEVAQLGNFPYLVSCSKDSIPGSCGGIILASRYILTSVKCSMDGLDEVTAAGGIKYRVKDTLHHPKSEGKFFDNNIALLRTVEPIKFSNNIQSANLLSSNVSDQTYFNAIGWDKDGQGNLTYLELRTINTGFCKIKLQNSKISDHHICTNNKFGQGLCGFADNGSPLVDRDGYVVGIANTVKRDNECAKGDPDVYMRVYAFKDWIEQTMRTNDGSERHNANMTTNFIVWGLLIIISNFYFQ